MVETGGKKESEEYKEAKSKFDHAFGVQRIKSKRFPLEETLKTARDIQQKVVKGEINRDVLFLIAEAMGTIDKKRKYLYLGYIAVAINNVRQALLKKEVDLEKAGVTARVDYQNIEKLLVLLAANGLEKEREYLVKKVPYQVMKKMEARIARDLVVEQRPDLAEEIPELSLDRKVELTQEYVGKLLGGLHTIHNTGQYRVLTGLVPESWRRPVFLKPKKVEKPLEEKKETPEKKVEPKAKEKEVKKTSKEGAKAVKVEDLGLGLVAKVLEKAGYPTLVKIKEAGLEKVSAVKGVGPKTVEALEEALDHKA